MPDAIFADEEWAVVRRALRPAGRLVSESRDPAKKAWLEWTRARTYRRIVVPARQD